jgi:hypothetical protein
MSRPGCKPDRRLQAPGRKDLGLAMLSLEYLDESDAQQGNQT